MSTELKSQERKVKYRVTKYHLKIELVEIESETAQFITRKGYNRREAKVSDYERFFDSWEEARAWLRERALARITKAEAEIRMAHEDLTAIENLKR